MSTSRLQVAALVVAACLVLAATASADTALRSSAPRDGATLAATPAVVRATFEGVLGRLDGAEATKDGEPVAGGPARVDPANAGRVLVPLRDAGAGRYVVAISVRAGDGHPLTSEIEFTVAEPSVGPVIDRVAALVWRAAAQIRAALPIG